MCLSCCHGRTTILYKEDISELFDLSKLLELFPEGTNLQQLKNISSYTGNFVHTHDNKTIELTGVQCKEIVDHAIAVIVTGVDTQLDIWAIQWPTDYNVTTFNLFQ